MNGDLISSARYETPIELPCLFTLEPYHQILPYEKTLLAESYIYFIIVSLISGRKNIK